MLDIRAVIVSHFLKRRHNTLFPTQDTVPKIFPVKENEKNIVFLVTNIEAYCLKVLYILPYGRTQCYCSYFGDTCGHKMSPDCSFSINELIQHIHEIILSTRIYFSCLYMFVVCSCFLTTYLCEVLYSLS